MSLIGENLQSVRERIEAAAHRVGRNPDDIILVAVTKTRSVDEIKEAIAHGICHIGENYVQEAEKKFPEIGSSVRWHMIGHLQRNKAKHAVEIFDVVHSVDSEQLARELGRRAQAANKCVDVLVEVNISGEQTKFGVGPDDALELVETIREISGIRLCGLMGMAPIVEDPEETRPYFAKLKELWDKLPEENRIYLSMGMTQDFEVAIEEGSNMVRIGTAIFGPRA
ncbi:MAG: YggS family pyridoxal phosphate-dependent enzyme [Armatimonadota bacterium]|nr:YggS family pyridoxal phosphate-dependent enzyme [Armatimonadota bacterium]